MSLTLPVEDLARVALSIKVFLPDGSFAFDMEPSPSCSTRSESSGPKLHFHGTHDQTGGISFTVWVTGLPGTYDGSDERASTSSEACLQVPHHIPSSNYLPFPAESNSALSQTPPYFPCVGDSNSNANSGCATTDLTTVRSINTSTNVQRQPTFEHHNIASNSSAECLPHPRHYRIPSTNYLPFSAESSSAFSQTPAAKPPCFPCVGDSGCATEAAARSTNTYINAQHRPLAEDHNYPLMGWPQYLDDATLPQYVLDSNNTFHDTSLTASADTRPCTPPSHRHAPSPAPPAYTHQTYVPLQFAVAESTTASVDARPSDPPQSNRFACDTPPTPSSSSSSPSDSSSSPSRSAPSPPPPDPTRPFKCLHARCPLWFKRAYTRRVHMATHNTEARKFVCTFAACGMEFSRKHDRLRHEVGSHGRGTGWRCAACGTHFSSETTLERHRFDRHADHAGV